MHLHVRHNLTSWLGLGVPNFNNAIALALHVLYTKFYYTIASCSTCSWPWCHRWPLERQQPGAPRPTDCLAYPDFSLDIYPTDLYPIETEQFAYASGCERDESCTTLWWTSSHCDGSWWRYNSISAIQLHELSSVTLLVNFVISSGLGKTYALLLASKGASVVGERVKWFGILVLFISVAFSFSEWFGRRCYWRGWKQ